MVRFVAIISRPHAVRISQVSFLITQIYLFTNFYIKSKYTQYSSPCLMIILEVNQALIKIKK